LEPNAFFEPSFALPAAQHLSALRSPLFLTVSAVSEGGGRGEMVGLWPLAMPKRGSGGLARTWIHRYSACGTPLLKASRAPEAFDLMMGWLERNCPNVSGVELPCLNEAGPVAALVGAHAQARGLNSQTLDRRLRAALSQAKAHADDSVHKLAEGRPKTLRRQWRKLSALGDLRYQSWREPSEIRVAMEAFLALEAAGWKGRSGTALLLEPGVVTFARTMTRLLAQEGRCRVESLELDGKPLAMLIVLYSGDRAFTWKIAYDEVFAAYSPGSQIIHEFTGRQMRDPRVAMIDSCSASDTPFIDRLWSDKLAIADVFVAVSPAQSATFQHALGREILRRKLRRSAKQAYGAMPKPRI
jgi:CelD/BcsL family acetyltransferase involved in cellulose biosynthesis